MDAGDMKNNTSTKRTRISAADTTDDNDDNIGKGSPRIAASTERQITPYDPMPYPDRNTCILYVIPHFHETCNFLSSSISRKVVETYCQDAVYHINSAINGYLSVYVPEIYIHNDKNLSIALAISEERMITGHANRSIGTKGQGQLQINTGNQVSFDERCKEIMKLNFNEVSLSKDYPILTNHANDHDYDLTTSKSTKINESILGNSDQKVKLLSARAIRIQGYVEVQFRFLEQSNSYDNKKLSIQIKAGGYTFYSFPIGVQKTKSKTSKSVENEMECIIKTDSEFFVPLGNLLKALQDKNNEKISEELFSIAIKNNCLNELASLMASESLKTPTVQSTFDTSISSSSSSSSNGDNREAESNIDFDYSFIDEESLFNSSAPKRQRNNNNYRVSYETDELTLNMIVSIAGQVPNYVTEISNATSPDADILWDLIGDADAGLILSLDDSQLDQEPPTRSSDKADTWILCETQPINHNDQNVDISNEVGKASIVMRFSMKLSYAGIFISKYYDKIEGKYKKIPLSFVVGGEIKTYDLPVKYAKLVVVIDDEMKTKLDATPFKKKNVESYFWGRLVTTIVVNMREKELSNSTLLKLIDETMNLVISEKSSSFEINRQNLEGEYFTLALYNIDQCKGKIQKIDFSMNKINSHEASQLFDCLRDDKSVTNINLSWNEIDDECISSLINLLTSNATIREINFDQTFISREGINRIEDWLKEHKSFVEIRFPDTDEDSSGTEKEFRTFASITQDESSRESTAKESSSSSTIREAW